MPSGLGNFKHPASLPLAFHAIPTITLDSLFPAVSHGDTKTLYSAQEGGGPSSAEPTGDGTELAHTGCAEPTGSGR